MTERIVIRSFRAPSWRPSWTWWPQKIGRLLFREAPRPEFLCKWLKCKKWGQNDWELTVNDTMDTTFSSWHQPTSLLRIWRILNLRNFLCLRRLGDAPLDPRSRSSAHKIGYAERSMFSHFPVFDPIPALITGNDMVFYITYKMVVMRLRMFFEVADIESVFKDLPSFSMYSLKFKMAAKISGKMIQTSWLWLHSRLDTHLLLLYWLGRSCNEIHLWTNYYFLNDTLMWTTYFQRLCLIQVLVHFFCKILNS